MSVEKAALRFLVYSQGTPKEMFSEQLRRQGAFVASDGAKRSQDFELIVLDGSTLKPEELSRYTPAIQSVLEHNRPVLLLEPTLDHKQVLAKARILRHYIQAPSLALLIEPRRDKANQLRIGLAEQFPTTVGRAVCTAAQASRDGPSRRACQRAAPGCLREPPGRPQPVMQQDLPGYAPGAQGREMLSRRKEAQA
ncbi:hypothetical protein [Stigmatella aurantiaca]|nr:hypothetical protein [Stigmatella aurantiaca]